MVKGAIRMKFKINKKYIGWGLTALTVIILSICFVYFIYNGNILLYKLKNLIRICMPIIDGFVVAYLLSPVINYLEQKCLIPIYRKLKIKNTNKTRASMRIFSIIITFVLVFLLIYSFIIIVIPQLYRSVQNIVISFPTYINNLVNFANRLLQDNPDIEATFNTLITRYSSELSSWLNSKLLPGMNDIIKSFSLGVLGFVVNLWNLIIGFIISVYLLCSKEKFVGQAKKIIYSMTKKERANNFLSDMRFINYTFGGFISGKLIDSLIIGLICFIFLSIIGTPYPILISVIVGVTNIIPFFGPYLGAIPSAILILLIEPIQCLYFLIFILILQQFDGNFLGPKILGNSTGLSSFWVIFSITLFGGLFGILGMILGVPAFAVIYAFIRRKIQKRLLAKGLPVTTTPYIYLDRITEEDKLILHTGEYDDLPDSISYKVNVEEVNSLDFSNHYKKPNHKILDKIKTLLMNLWNAITKQFKE